MPEQEKHPLREPAHEVYPSAPLRFVAFEARFSPVPFFETEKGRLALYDGLSGEFPILHAGPSQPDPFAAGQVMRMMDRSRTIATAVSPAAVSIETSNYQHFNWFIDLIRKALQAVARVAAIPTVQRVGLRYTDEIRVPGVNHPADWSHYVNASLLGPLELVSGVFPEEHHAQIAYRIHDQHQILFRYGALEGWSVDPEGPLSVSNKAAGPYFLIDLDSFWTAPSTEFPEFSVDHTIDLVKDLHDPLRSLFEASITDHLRDSVFRKPPASRVEEDREVS